MIDATTENKVIKAAQQFATANGMRFKLDSLPCLTIYRGNREYAYVTCNPVTGQPVAIRAGDDWSHLTALPEVKDGILEILAKTV